jgi:two-component system, OmpR family, sensor histidine kinase KdpD
MPSSSEQRPDPDVLLAKVKHEEARAQRGKLRIYFGSSAGVGKTYAMLVAARKLSMEGRDVLLGVIETHGRAETAALLSDLETLPPAVGLSRQATHRIRSRRRAVARTRR